jgi:hypothetical protein
MRRIPAVPSAALACAAALLGCTGGNGSDPGPGSLRTLTASEVGRVLAGNTLVGRDGKGPFWMHYPSERTVWGLASNGDVDIGRWWVAGNRYCRAWRHWSDGREQCWLLATDGSSRLIWIEPDGRSSGQSTIQAGNTIGKLTRPQQADALIASDAPPQAGAPLGDEVPVDATGAILVARYVAGAADDRASGIDSGSSPGTAGSSAGGSGGGGSSGGNGSNGGNGSSGGGGSGGGGTSGGGDDGDGGGGDDGGDDGDGGGDDGDNGNSGRGKGGRGNGNGNGNGNGGGDD